MARRLSVAQTQQTRVVHYVDRAMHAELARYGQLDPAEIVRQQQRNTELYLRWKDRQEEIKERDRKVRRFWLGFGALVGLGFLTAVAAGGWLVWTFLASLSLGVFAVPAILLLAGGLAFGGSRCVTIVQHWH